MSRGRGLSISAYVGAVLLAIFAFMAIFGPWLAPYPPFYTPSAYSLFDKLEGPSMAHWLGTGENGIDLLSSLLAGARVAGIISVSVVLISATVGTAIGVLAGYLGGKVDEAIMRVVDVLLAFPGILLNIAIVALLARPGVGVLIFALCLNGWVGYARVARGQVLSVRELEFVTAARAVGVPALSIMRRHILPNILSPIIVQMTFGFGTVILVEASLSFLGLGPQLPYTWGSLLEQGSVFLWRPRLALVPGLAIMLVVLGCNLLGDGLRDRFDPKRRRLG
jgi:peptide/nickel transport system permease protein